MTTAYMSLEQMGLHMGGGARGGLSQGSLSQVFFMWVKTIDPRKGRKGEGAPKRWPTPPQVLLAGTPIIRTVLCPGFLHLGWSEHFLMRNYFELGLKAKMQYLFQFNGPKTGG